MKALDEYFLMVVFEFSLNRVHVFTNFMFGQRNMAVKGLKGVCHLSLALFPNAQNVLK